MQQIYTEWKQNLLIMFVYMLWLKISRNLIKCLVDQGNTKTTKWKYPKLIFKCASVKCRIKWITLLASFVSFPTDTDKVYQLTIVSEWNALYKYCVTFYMIYIPKKSHPFPIASRWWIHFLVSFLYVGLVGPTLRGDDC